MGKTVVAFAPGRVELLGNHTDYNERLALAVAIHLGVTGLNLLQREITGRTITVDAAPRRAGDPAVLVAASNKICKELGWAPQFPHVREIVESAWQWHQANPNGY
jgi:UDP-glucose 4-epimerase